MEFFENVNNSENQFQLRSDIVSTRQTFTQSLTEFVLIKNQLACRLNTGRLESDLVGIAGLRRDIFRVHIRLHRSLTFGKLRRIAGVLDLVTDIANLPTKQEKKVPNPQKVPP